jgi:hypothetical protein
MSHQNRHSYLPETREQVRIHGRASLLIPGRDLVNPISEADRAIDVASYLRSYWSKMPENMRETFTTNVPGTPLQPRTGVPPKESLDPPDVFVVLVFYAEKIDWCDLYNHTRKLYTRVDASEEWSCIDINP